MLDARLPAGWTLAEIRRVSGDREAIALGTDRAVTWVAGLAGDEAVEPELVLGFHSLCLVKPVGDSDWYMGGLNDDGSVDCWDAYSDLYDALRGL